MVVYVCSVCIVYVYDEDDGDTNTGLDPKTSWKEIPDTWRCPICEAKKDSLKLLDEREAEEIIKKYQSSQPDVADSIEYSLTLDEVRKNAQAKLKGICSINKVCDGDPKRLCMGQKYGGPIGLGGAGKGLSFTSNIVALDKLKLKTRVISNHVEPDMTTKIFDKEISMPIMSSSMAGVKANMGDAISEENFTYAVLRGSNEAGTIGWIGNTAEEDKELVGVETIRNINLGIPIFKPQKNEKLFVLLKLAEEVGAAAVGIDLDGVGNQNWENKNKPLFRKSVDELRELVDYTELTFIAKGIMSVEDALDALDAGAGCIDVSNHGGRGLDSTRGVAEVLPEIVKELKGKITITADGGVRTGFDVLKMLALGADSVLVGRDIIRAALGGGAKGVALHFDYLVSELRRGMLLTSCNNISDINDRILDMN